MVEHVLCLGADDVDVSDLYGKTDANDVVFSTARLLASPLVLAQALLSHVHMAIFAVPPTPCDIRAMYGYLGILFETQGQSSKLKDLECAMGAMGDMGDMGDMGNMNVVARKITNHVVHNSFMRWRDTDHALKNRLVEELTVLVTTASTDATIARKELVRRWSYKVGHALDETSTLLSMVTVLMNDANVLSDANVPSVPIATNKFTGVAFEMPVSRDMSIGERLRFAITNDVYFQGARMFGGSCVVIVPDVPLDELDELDTNAELALSSDYRNIMSSSSHRPIVLFYDPISTANKDEVQRLRKLQERYPENDVHVVSRLEFMNIPRAFERCCTVCNNARNVPPSLSRKKEASTRVSSIAISDSTYGRDIYTGLVVPMKESMWIPMVSTALIDKQWVRDMRAHVFQRCLADTADVPFVNYAMRKCHAAGYYYGTDAPRFATEVAPITRAILAIDNRRNPMTVFAILQSLSCLEWRQSWSVVVLCTPDSREYYEDALAHIKNKDIRVSRDLMKANFNVEDYNMLMKSDALWSSLKAAGLQTVLTVQDDGLLARPMTEEAFARYSQYDYVGAPWVDVPFNAPLKLATRGHMTGNGGLSLRSVDAMLKVCKTRHNRLFHTLLSTEPEDVFFASGVENLCPGDLALTFASEQVLSFDSIGFHKPWPYHTKATVARFFAALP